jgi:hypothetical protein
MNSKPKKLAQLREFGFILAGGLSLIFGVIGPWLRNHPAPIWLWMVNSILVAFALLAPKTLAPIEKLWLRLGNVLGAINSRIILTIVFYGLFTPMGIAMRIKGHDPLGRKMNSSLKSYRATTKPRAGKHMLKPY